ncbi:hypothetical protein SAMN06269301_3509 [Geobacter sp. DSM 9736]|nr:hypothetical protein SAMN06269301_3509 [Geobacter sp. DSM 9736]
MVLRALGMSFMVCLMSVASAIGVTDSPQSREPSERQGEESTREREEACECCMKCMAASRAVRGKEEGPPLKDGCRDCCRKCGTTDLPSQKSMPPEIIK